jgi:hypothetical protein
LNLKIEFKTSLKCFKCLWSWETIYPNYYESVVYRY